jgi:hypothetical protein
MMISPVNIGLAGLFYYLCYIKIIIMKQIIIFLQSLIAFLPEYLFGVRVEGERLMEPTTKATLPTESLSENDWYQTFNVSRACTDRGPILRAQSIMEQWKTDWSGLAK